MLIHTKKNPPFFLGGAKTIYILGWVLTVYLFGYPKNRCFFLKLCPEHFHFLPSRLLWLSGGMPSRQCDRGPQIATRASRLDRRSAMSRAGWRSLDPRGKARRRPCLT
jgi:hypothetical protein